MHDAFEEPDMAFLVLDYCPRGDMYNFLQEFDVDERSTSWLMAQVALAVQEVHSLGFAHRFALAHCFFSLY